MEAATAALRARPRAWRRGMVLVQDSDPHGELWLRGLLHRPEERRDRPLQR